MTTWNLTEFSELEDSVLTPYENITAARKKPRVISTTSVLATLVVAATVITSLSISGIERNAHEFRYPASSMESFQSSIEKTPPLQEMFSGRFDEAWTPELEDRLLVNIESNRRELSKAELLEQAVDSIFYNQQEDVSGQGERLSREDVKRIVEERKIV